MQKYYIRSTKYNIQERITKLNGKVYDVVFRVITIDGIVKQIRLSGYKTKALAKAAHADYIQKHCQSIKNSNITLKNIESGKTIPTVSELIPLYLSTLSSQNKQSTVYDKRHVYDLYVIPMLGDCKITELTKEKLYQWQDFLLSQSNPKTKQPYCYPYIKKIRGHLSSFLSWAESRYDYPNNLEKVNAPKKRAQKTEMQFWSREEFDRFISVVDEPLYHCLFTMLFFTGRRKSEVFALTPDDVKSDYIMFNKAYSRKTTDGSKYIITSTKNEKKGKTPICEPLAEELSGYTPQYPFFFGGKNPLPETSVTRKFNYYIEKSGVKKIRIHDLRHSYVSMLLYLGASVMVVADLIGDTVAQVLNTYGHLYEEDKLNIIKKVR